METSRPTFTKKGCTCSDSEYAGCPWTSRHGTCKFGIKPEEIAEIKASNKELLRVLRVVEWGEGEDTCCPICWGNRSSGHGTEGDGQDCQLAVAIANAEKLDEEK